MPRFVALLLAMLATLVTSPAISEIWLDEVHR